MEVICMRDCRNAVEQRHNLETTEISDEETCTRYEKWRDYYREDNVVIYDDAGLPSIMVKFTRSQDAEKIHPMFIIGGEVCDEIFISKYKNCIIDGKAYSLPMQKAETNITLKEAERACFSKGEGWHLLTAAERGFLANYCYDNETFPHGNTDYGKWHGDEEEKCRTYDDCRMLTGSGTRTWMHDYTIFGADGLCGDIYEWFRGLRLMNGVLQVSKDNDAAMNIDLSESSENWKPLLDGGEEIRLDCTEGGVTFTTCTDIDADYDGCRWKNVNFDCSQTEELRALGLYAGEPDACFYADTKGERLPVCGGSWSHASYAGVFSVDLNLPRSYSLSSVGFRSAYYRKRKK